MIRPLEDRVLVKPLSPDSTSSGGIVIPAVAQEKSQRGVVLAVGEGKKLESGGRGDMALRPEDVVIFSKYAGTEIKAAGEEVLLMREGDVLAVIDES